MLKSSIENIKTAILERNTYFQNGFCNVYQNEDKGIVISGDKPVFPADLGNYFYLRLPKNVSFTNGGNYAIADTIKGIGLNAEITLVACVKDADNDKLLTNLVNTLQALCDENISLTNAIYNSNEVIKQELAFMSKKSRDKALSNLPRNLSIVSVSFTYSTSFTFNNCITNPCTC